MFWSFLVWWRQDSLAEVEEKYRKAMVSNAQLDNEKSNLMYEVDTLKDSLMELEELLSESRRQYEDKAKVWVRHKHQSQNKTCSVNKIKRKTQSWGLLPGRFLTQSLKEKVLCFLCRTTSERSTPTACCSSSSTKWRRAWSRARSCWTWASSQPSLGASFTALRSFLTLLHACLSLHLLPSAAV